ncbi:MAG: VOC family protein [Bacteroidetes bacterium]|nr:VOC family protein [Bacteroidota bacterium]
MQKIHPFLWFDNQAEEAANFYVSIFKNSKISGIARNPQDGAVLTAGFQLDGVDFTALNGGPLFKFTEAVSFAIDCENQEEVDYYWDSLIAGGGQPSQCGWLKDKFGLSWQVVPKVLIQLLQDKDKAKAGRVFQAMMKQTKPDIKKLEEAAAQTK